MSGKTVRRSIMALWDDSDTTSATQEELDRVMIAFHRFQTEGRVAYRRILGMHGGGGGTSDPEFKAILKDKVHLDIVNHADTVEEQWPSPCSNFPLPTSVDVKENPFSYTFCWHAQPEFIVWHRGLMAEFERTLQEYDPKYKGSAPVHEGPDALGVPYWAWEGWDGHTLPHQFTDMTYTVRTNKWNSAGFYAGSSFANPFRRWYAPVSLDQQEKEYFPAILDNTNCTTRSISFDHPEIRNSMPWFVPGVKSDLIVIKIIFQALSESNYYFFATMKKGVGSNKSIETPHNRFHNRVGGYALGGTRGTGKQYIDPTNEDTAFTGTMTQNQSIFDPIFWLHHSNVERQFCSWQKHWIWDVDPANRKPESTPSSLLNKVLYPWTKPSKLAAGHCSWNTPVGEENDATFGDLWEFGANLTYEYDQLLPVIQIPDRSKEVHIVSNTGIETLNLIRHSPEKRIRLTAYFNSPPRGELSLFVRGHDLPISSVSVLNSSGFGCVRCREKENAVSFEVTDHLEEFGFALNDPSAHFNIVRMDLDRVIDVVNWEVTPMTSPEQTLL